MEQFSISNIVAHKSDFVVNNLFNCLETLTRSGDGNQQRSLDIFETLNFKDSLNVQRLSRKGVGNQVIPKWKTSQVDEDIVRSIDESL